MCLYYFSVIQTAQATAPELVKASAMIAAFAQSMRALRSRRSLRYLINSGLVDFVNPLMPVFDFSEASGSHGRMTLRTHNALWIDHCILPLFQLGSRLTMRQT